MSSDEKHDDRLESLRQELLEYHFDCHPDPEAIEHRLESDPELRRLYEEVQGTASLLADAAKDEAPEMDFVAPASTAIPPRRSWSFRRTWILAAGLSGMFVLPCGARWAYKAWQAQDVMHSKLRMIVSAPPAVPDGATMRFAVDTRDLAEQPKIAQVEWKVLNAKGEVLSHSTTMSSGKTEIEVGGSLLQPRQLVVKATVPQTGFSKTITQRIHPSKAAPLVHLTSDKPAYRPGESVRMRIACLDRLSLKGASLIGLRCRIVDQKGSAVAQQVLGVGKGVAAWQWAIPAHQPGGQYALEVRDAEDRITLERMQILVRNFQPPRLQKKVTLDRQTYDPGTIGHASLQVSRATGGPAVGATVYASLVVDGEESWKGEGRLDASGRATFRFDVPAAVKKGAARFVAKIQDSNIVETWMEPFVIPTDEIEVALYPESGQLLAGVENRVYAQVRDPFDRPLSGKGEVVDESGAVVAKFETQHLGRARFAFTPAANRTYRVRLESPKKRTVDLPPVQVQGAIFQVPDFVPAGEPARVVVQTNGRGPWVIAGFCRGVMVGQQNILRQGTSTIELELAEEASGVLRLTVFDHKLRPIAERLVSRDSKRQLSVVVTPESARRAPGEKQKIRVKTTDETGEPVSAIVGLTVRDRAVGDMLDFIRTGLSDQRDLFTDVEKPDDKEEELLAGHEHRRRNVDLLLGCQGWRRYVWQGDTDEAVLAKAGGDWAKALPIREGRSSAPLIADTKGMHQAALAVAILEKRDARLWTYYAAAWSLVGLVLLALVHVLTRFGPRQIPAPIFVPATLAATATLVIVLLPNTLGEMAPAELAVMERVVQLDAVTNGRADFELLDSIGVDYRGLAAERGLIVDGSDDNWSRGLDNAGAADPAAEPSSGFFYDDGEDGDSRGRSENFFAESLGDFAVPVYQAGVRVTSGYIRDFDVQVAQGAVVVDSRRNWTRDYGYVNGVRSLEGTVTLPLRMDFDAFGQAANAPRWSYGLGNESVLYVSNPTLVANRLPRSLLGAGPSGWSDASEIAMLRGMRLADELAKLEVAPQQTAAGRAEFQRRQQLLDFVNQRYPGVVPMDGKLPRIRALAPDQRRVLETVLSFPSLAALQFAYQHQTADARQNFAEVLFWKPFLVTNEKGEAEVEFDVGDSVSTYMVYADAHGGGRVGQGEGSFESYLPFHLEAKIPQEVSEGDVLRIPVAVSCDDASTTEARVEVAVSGPITLKTTGPRTVKLRAGRGRLVAEITVGEAADGAAKGFVSIVGQVGAAKDRVQQQFTIVPRGFPHRFDHAGSLKGIETKILHVPDELARRTGTLALRFYPSPLASLEEGLAGMLQEPGGCFEQVSSSNYPNVMVLSLLNASGDNIPEAAVQARGMLERGYEKLAAYEVEGGGFEWWGKKPAHACLTAYGLMQFTDMREVYEGVDTAMVARTRAWLLGKRDGKGGFITGGGRYGHFQGGSKEARSAYIAYALLYSGEKPEDMQAEIDFLEARATETENAYELAVAACALGVARRDASAKAARMRLVKLQKPDGSLHGTGSITGSGEHDLATETTSFAILTWLAAEGEKALAGPVTRAMDFLVKRREGAGSFGGTQATVMALKALTTWARSNARAVRPGAILVSVNGQEVENRRLFGSEKRTITLHHVGRHLKVGDNALRVELTGENEMPFSLEWRYRADLPQSSPRCAVKLRTWLSRSVLAEGDATAIHAVISNDTDQVVASPMVIVGIPAGLHVDSRILDDLKKAETIAAWEVKDREIALYLRGLKGSESREIVIDATARIPGKTKAPASRAYLYYAHRDRVWTAPLDVDVGAR